MPLRIEFAKLSGSGNDFICLDGSDGRFDGLLASGGRVGHFARTLCRRRLGVGADGVIFGLGSADAAADIACRFFEPDGSEAEFCGNGTACLARWAIANGWLAADGFRIHTQAGVVMGQEAEGGYIREWVPVPTQVEADVALGLEGERQRCDFAVTGVPHAVVYVDDVAAVDVARLGPAIRHHERFQPRGVNVNFTQVLGEGEIAVRTFEFGVEDETLACGSGSATAAVLSALRFGWPTGPAGQAQPVRVHVRSGDVIRVYVELDAGGAPARVCLETVVRFLYRGAVEPALATLALGQEAGCMERHGSRSIP